MAKGGLAPLLARSYLIFLLLAGVLLGAFPLVAAVLVLLFFQAVALYRPPPPRLDLVLIVLTLLLAPLALAPLVGSLPAAFLILPAMLLADEGLRSLVHREAIPPFRKGLRTTPLLNYIAGTLGAMGLLAAALGSMTLLVSSALLLGGLLVRLSYSVRHFRSSPLVFQARRLRVVAGSEGRITLELGSNAPFPLRAQISSPHPWLKVLPPVLSFRARGVALVEVVVTPPLAGPAFPALQVATIDPRGLLEAGYIASPLELHVIPRQRYAAWLARRYLEETRGWEAMVATSPQSPRRRGVEYYGLREYQPGDRFRDIDWLRTRKFGELVVKEHLEPSAGATIILVNLIAADPEEADWLAYHLVVSAVSAARQGMHTSVIAYNEQEVVLATGPLPGREAVKEALRLSMGVALAAVQERLLAPPDVLRLKRMVHRLSTDGGDGAALTRLLSLELEALEDLAYSHPLQRAFEKLLKRSGRGGVITLVTRWNHDAEALAVALPRLRSLGYRVVDLLKGSPVNLTGGRSSR